MHNTIYYIEYNNNIYIYIYICMCIYINVFVGLCMSIILFNIIDIIYMTLS